MFAYAAAAQVMASMLPLFLQNGLGQSALQAGFDMLPFALAMLVFPHIGRLLERRLSSASILTIGLLFVAVGNAITAWGAYSVAWHVIMGGMIVLGGGGGLLNGETQKAIMSAVPHERSGMASGISTTSRFSGIFPRFLMGTAYRISFRVYFVGNGFNVNAYRQVGLKLQFLWRNRVPFYFKDKVRIVAFRHALILVITSASTPK
nr:MFS transporter [Acetobacter senegalensis]